MRRLLIIFMLTLFSTNVFAQKDPEGYKGIKWGTRYNAIEDQYSWDCRSSDRHTMCVIEEDVLLYGNVEVSAAYFFYDNKFAGVIFSGELGEGQWEKVVKSLASVYGQNEKISGDAYLKAQSKSVVSAQNRSGTLLLSISENNPKILKELMQ